MAANPGSATVRELLQATALDLSNDEIEALSAGKTVRLKEFHRASTSRAAANDCGGIKIFCKNVGGRECCVYIDWKDGPQICVSCS